MRVHEYQAKAILSEFDIPIPAGGLATTPEEARHITEQLGGRAVLKAQIHAGGRGRAGGIKTASSPQEAEELAKSILGTWLITHQTPPSGLPVSKILVEEEVKAEGEIYLGIIVDGQRGLPIFIASSEGGVEIEEVAKRSPEKIVRESIDPALGFQAFQRRKLAYGLGLPPNLASQVMDIMGKLYQTFMVKDCSLAEINPLVITPQGKLLALDAKLNFDDNALFRHPEIAKLRDQEQEDPLEVQALSLGLRNYVKLDGNIGCMVNGAGLAMSVLDLITLAGGKPANFLDIGTLNTTDRVVNAFKVFLQDPRVKGVLINIFGGMARVDVIAKGLVEAFSTLDIPFPVIVRLAGTNVEEGKQILAQSKLPIIEAEDLTDAANKVVQAVKG